MGTTPPPGAPPPGSNQGSKPGSNQGWNQGPPWGSPAGGFGRRIEEAMELIEMELRHAIAYVNDAVVPQVRRESISAMRTVADTLQNLADRFERNANQPPPPGQPPKGPES